MVWLMNSSNPGPESGNRSKFFVKLETEDSLDDEYGPVHKRSKLQQQWNTGSASSSVMPSQHNLLEEPSPLGLSLRKSPSLLDLIQMRISQENASSLGRVEENRSHSGRKKGVKDSTAGSGATDKLKASNFSATLLKIGMWEYVSKYEGDLVAKCYFAKHKLVWEVLKGGLKSKIEIQWSDITALKANIPDAGPSSLEIVLARQPLFFRETNPQPRKHTLWQATSDFTDGQASIHRRHFLECPEGFLAKHFEKLMQCDLRLNHLSQQPVVVLDSPYFESKGSVCDEPAEAKCAGFDQLNRENATPFYGFRDAPSPSASFLSSSKSELLDLSVDRAPEQHIAGEYTSPCSVMDSQVIEEGSGIGLGQSKGLSHWDQFRMAGLHTSIPMTDLASHLGHCISQQMTSADPLIANEGLQKKNMLDEITQHLLSDSQFASVSDENKLMSRVNSLCCLLQKDSSTIPSFQISTDGFDGQKEDQVEPTLDNKITADSKDHEGELLHTPERKQAMSRKDSFGDLLLNLPRIASLPQFLFHIAEDAENQAR